MCGEPPEIEGLLSIDLDARSHSDGFEEDHGASRTLDRARRDPFDRIIVATALERALPVVSKDGALDEVPGGGLQRVW